MPSPAELTVIHLAPRSGTSGVGDHADDVAAALRERVRAVVELRHGPPRADSVADVRRFRRQVREAVDAVGGPVVVHAELSGGAVAPLWALVGLHHVPRTATLHDPPRPVWYPYLTRGVAQNKYVAHGAHLPLTPLTRFLERRVLRDVDVFALSREGVEAMRAAGIGRSQAESHLIVADRPALPPAAERPRAVGLFGHVYRGKGFDRLAQIRAGLADDVALRVAGRGTEALPALPGVEVLGAVEGAEEDAFFGSIQALLLPYERRHVYGQEAFPASSVLARAVAYATPSLSLAVGQLTSAASAGATRAVDGDAEGLGRAATALLADPLAVRAAADDVAAFRATQTVESALAPYLDTWGRL